MQFLGSVFVCRRRCCRRSSSCHCCCPVSSSEVICPLSFRSLLVLNSVRESPKTLKTYLPLSRVRCVVFAGPALQTLMCHVGFQQLYREEAAKYKSPKETIYHYLGVHKEKLDKVTVVGHSLGGGDPAFAVAIDRLGGGTPVVFCCCKGVFRFQLQNQVRPKTVGR